MEKIHEEYRQKLAEQLKAEPNKLERHKILEEAQATDEYRRAKVESYLQKSRAETTYRKMTERQRQQIRQQTEAEAPIIDKVFDTIFTKYGLTDREDKGYIIDNLRRKLRGAARKFGGVENLKGKRILDIGSGSNFDSFDIEMNQEYGAHYGMGSDAGRIFEPWFCRGLLELGAQPVGIDIGNLDREQFEHHQMDLTYPKSLDFLPDESFDGINMRLFLSSPELDNTLARHRVDIKKFKINFQKELARQIHRLLKKGGVIIHMDNIFH